jgi:tetratricopeptide (TPR) repeat protein
MPLEALTAITDHYLAADVAEKTIPYALEAGLRHLDLFANGPAETYLGAGLTRLDIDDGSQIAMRLNYLRGLAEVLLRTGRTDVARERCEEAIALAQELGDDFLLGRLLATLARVLQGLDELVTSLHYGEWAVSVSIGSQDLVGAARCMIVNARTRFYKGEEAAASVELERALELARRSGDKAILGEALANMGYLLVAIDTGKLGEGMACLNEAVNLLAEVGDKQGEMTSRGMMGNAQSKVGDYAAAQLAFGQALGLAREVGNQPEICSNQIELAINALELGDFKAAINLARAGSEAAVRVQSTYQMGTGVAVEAYAQAHLGHFDEAEALMHVASDLASELNHKFMEIRVEQYRAEVLLLMGRLDAAADSAEKLRRLMQETGNLEPQARLYALLGEVIGRQGDLEGARAYLDGALAIATLGLVRGTEARVLKGQAWLAMRAGEWEVAQLQGTSALALARTLQMAYMQAELEDLLGEVALATGRPEAYQHFQEMASICAAHDYVLLEAQASFGLAAARPYAPGVADEVAKAQAQLQRLAAGLDEEARSCFLGSTERARILQGNHIAFSLPIAGNAVSKPNQGPGMWKMLDR